MEADWGQASRRIMGTAERDATKRGEVAHNTTQKIEAGRRRKRASKNTSQGSVKSSFNQGKNLPGRRVATAKMSTSNK